MSRFHTNDTLSHREAAEMLGVTALEFADMRRNGEIREPDGVVCVTGEAPRWMRSTILKLKQYRSRLACKVIPK